MRAVATLALLLCATPARAENLHFAGDAPRIYTIEPRAHMFSHELHLGAGVLPLDAFYVGTTFIASYGYHFNATYGWEIIDGFYSVNADTPLKKQLASFGVATTDDADDRLRFILSSSFFVKPLAGKIAVFNRGYGNVDTRFLMGIGLVNYAGRTQDRTQACVNLGIALHFWASRHVAVRFEARDYLAVGGKIDNLLLVALGGSFNFSVRTSDDESPTK